MFVGHYGPSLAIRAVRPDVPLWLLFVAAQVVDIAWAIFVLAGMEHVRIEPGITAASPLDLYYMPYTHSLPAAVAWSVAAAVVCRVFFRWRDWSAAAWVGVAVFSHWVIDFLVHRPDLPLWKDTAKVGLGLWNYVGLSFGLEAAVLIAGLALYLARTRALTTVGRYGPAVFVAAMLAMQGSTFVAPPPGSTTTLAVTALVGYLALAAIAGWLDRQRVGVS
jgi:membrane-bound metal-dependent hydrolase YbcI (DUF457 family)